jgi:hypothetical protein
VPSAQINRVLETIFSFNTTDKFWCWGYVNDQSIIF